MFLKREMEGSHGGGAEVIQKGQTLLEKRILLF